MTRALVVGDVMLDVVTRPTGPVQPTSDTPAATHVGRGGSSANVAVALAATGVEVVHVGAAGRDPAADLASADLAAHGVVVRWEILNGSTGVVVAVVAADGQRAMLTDRGVNARLSWGHVAAVLADGIDHVHVSGYTLLDEGSRAVGSRALEWARERGITTSVDACSAAPLRAVSPGVFVAALGRVTYLFANEEEAAVLGESDDLHRVARALAGTVAELVVTQGSRGAVVYTPEGCWRANADEVDVVDTTGAGDAAVGAYLGARVGGRAIDVALESAMGASARVVGRLGAR
ncbi:MAG: carbohydrate kinase family protein [Acidimicrobiales bacterium]